jgi:prevent-host-death family protein
MIATTFTEFRNQAKHFFDLVQAGETVRISRNGRPIADIGPVSTDLPSWKKRKATPMRVAGVEIAQQILQDRGRVFTPAPAPARRPGRTQSR